MRPDPATPSRQQHLQALLLALVCSVLFLRDALLPGRSLVPFPPELLDVRMAQAKTAGNFDADECFRGNASMGDKYLQSLCWDRVMHDRFRAGEMPAWTRDIGGGAPFVPQMAQPWEPINALLLFCAPEQWYGWWYLLHQVAFGWFAYVFFRRLGCLHASSLLGLVAAVLGLWTQCKLHHNVMLTAALPLWPMLIAVHDLANGHARRGRSWSAGWLAFWAGVSWSSGFVVVSLQATYLVLAYAAFVLLRAPRGERLRPALWIGGGIALGGVVSLANMVPVLLASAASARAGTFDAARLQSIGLEWDHALSAFWPDLLSWGADRFWPAATGDTLSYDVRIPWSQLVLLAQPLRPEDHSAFQNWVETSFAIGLVPMAVAAAALFDRSRRPLVLFFGSIALLSFGIATADQPFFALARLVPGICDADLRRLLFSCAMTLVVLATLGADAQIRSDRRWPPLVVLGAVLAASVAVLGWLAANGDDGSFVRAIADLCAADTDHPDVIARGGDAAAIARDLASVAHPGEAAHNHAMLHTTALRALLVAAFGIAALWLRPAPRAAVWIVATAVELVHAGLGPVQTVAAERISAVPNVLQPAVAAPTAEVRPRLQRLVTNGGGKLAALPGNLPGYHGIEDGGAYNPLPPARYEQFFVAIEPDRAGKPSVGSAGAGVGSFHDPASLRHPLCDLYGIRFVLTRDVLPTDERLVDRTPNGTGGFRLYERTTTLPRATFVDRVDLLPDASQRLAELGRPDRDVRRRIVLEDPTLPALAPGAAVDARVDIVEHRDERVVVRVTGNGGGWLRLADPWNAGWVAHLDGQRVPIAIADHYLRAVFVPATPNAVQHEIVFTYDAARVLWPPRLAGVALLAAIGLVVAGRRRRP